MLAKAEGTMDCLFGSAQAVTRREFGGSRRIIHRDEVSSQPGAELVLDGDGPWELARGFRAILTPGHR